MSALVNALTRNSMTMRLVDSRPRRVAGYRMGESPTPEGGASLTDPEARVALRLSPSAAVIWALCDGQHTVAEMVRRLREAYPDADAAIDVDVRETLITLTEHGAVEWT